MKRILIILVFGLLLSGLFSSGQIENPDTHLRLTQTRLLLEKHEFSLPDDIGVTAHANITMNDYGKRYMVYNPGQTVFFIPMYYFINIIFENSAEIYYKAAFLVSFVNYFIQVLCVYLLFKLALAIGAQRKRAIIMALFFGVASYSFSFAQSTYEHHFEMLFILLSYYIVISHKPLKHYGLYAGIALSAGILFRNTAFIALPGLLLLLNNRKDIFKMLLGVSLGVIVVMLYNYYRFTNPFEFGYTMAWVLAHGENIRSFWSIQRIPENFIGLLFSPGKGLFVYSPTLIISCIGFRKFYYHHKKLTISLAILSVCYLLLFSANFDWHGSIWAFGPRYILPIVPLLYLPIIELRIRKLFYLCIIIGFISQLLLISVNYKRNLLENYVKTRYVDDKEYIYNFNNIPYLVQGKQLIKILPKNLSKELENYQPDSFWRQEIRTGTNEQVLDNSIEKNSINFWWVRIFHWNQT